MDCMRLQPPQTNLGRAGFVNKNAATLPKTVCDFSELGSDRWLTSSLRSSDWRSKDLKRSLRGFCRLGCHPRPPNSRCAPPHSRENIEVGKRWLAAGLLCARADTEMPPCAQPPTCCSICALNILFHEHMAIA